MSYNQELYTWVKNRCYYDGPAPSYSEQDAKVHLGDLKELRENYVDIDHVNFCSTLVIWRSHRYGAVMVSRDLNPQTGELADTFTIGISSEGIGGDLQLAQAASWVTCASSALMDANYWADDTLRLGESCQIDIKGI